MTEEYDLDSRVKYMISEILELVPFNKNQFLETFSKLPLMKKLKCIQLLIKLADFCIVELARGEFTND